MAKLTKAQREQLANLSFYGFYTSRSAKHFWPPVRRLLVRGFLEFAMDRGRRVIRITEAGRAALTKDTQP